MGRQESNCVKAGTNSLDCNRGSCWRWDDVGALPNWAETWQRGVLVRGRNDWSSVRCKKRDCDEALDCCCTLMDNCKLSCALLNHRCCLFAGWQWQVRSPQPSHVIRHRALPWQLLPCGVETVTTVSTSLNLLTSIYTPSSGRSQVLRLCNTNPPSPCLRDFNSTRYFFVEHCSITNNYHPSRMAITSIPL